MANTIEDILRALEENNGNKTKAAQSLGIPRETLRDVLSRADRGTEDTGERPEVEFPQLPDNDIPVEEIIDGMCTRFAKRKAYNDALRWHDIKINMDGPIGVSFFGDPHVDDNGCNWPLLRHHCKLHEETEGLYGVNIGDTTNNWIGRLTRLFANQETSQETARKLAYWLLAESGVTWVAWLLGNHDSFGDGAAVLEGLNATRIAMRKEKFPGMGVSEWQARFNLVFPNKKKCRIWASHDFPGHSMWNSLHGPLKAAHMKEEAELYICGHKHNWALHQEESAARGFVYWLARAKGYKDIDEHSMKMGHDDQTTGAAITQPPLVNGQVA